MPYTYVQAGDSLFKVEPSGIASELPVPSNLNFSQRRLRSAILGRRVCMVNSPSHNVMAVQGDPVIGTTDTVVSMSPIAPDYPLRAVVRSPTSEESGLTGTYKFKVSFLIEEEGNDRSRVIAESPLSEASPAITLSNQVYDLVDIPTSVESSITKRRIYRTLVDGNTYFELGDIDDNVTTRTSEFSDASDESIALAPAPTDLGNPPGSYLSSSRLELITSWKGRLFGRAGGVSTAIDKDVLLWSETRQPYAWPATNSLPIPPVGNDSFGITGLVPKRDKLGIGKRDALYAITSPSPLSGQLRRIASIGIIAPDSVIIKDDTVWFLSEDGVYMWGSDDLVTNITADNVHPWFTTDTHFNRAAFEDVVGFYHDERESIIWLIPGPGASVLNRWIEYYPNENVWLGPHETKEFTPTFISRFEDQDSVETAVFGGSNGILYEENSRGYDGDSTGQHTQHGEDARRTLIYNDTVEEAGSHLEFREVGITIPDSTLDASIVLVPEDGITVPLTDLPWSELASVDHAVVGDEARTSNSVSGVGSIFNDKVNVFVGKTINDRLLIAASEPIFPLDIFIYTVNPAAASSTIISRPAGIEVSIETQPQTAGQPDMFKHWGELSLQADIEAGHNTLVTTSVDDEDSTHRSPEKIVDRVRLPRIGDGHKMAIKIEESTTAPFSIYGYNISPVHIVGRR